MIKHRMEQWQPVDLTTLIADVIEAVESGEIDTAFDQVELTAGTFSRAKNIRNCTKNYLRACLQAGVENVAEATPDTALGLLNAYRMMNAEPPLPELPENYKVIAIKLHQQAEDPDVEIYIKEGNRILYGEKILPRGILTENFLRITGATLI